MFESDIMFDVICVDELDYIVMKRKFIVCFEIVFGVIGFDMFYYGIVIVKIGGVSE